MRSKASTNRWAATYPNSGRQEVAMQFRQSVYHALALAGILTMGVTGMACAQNGADPKSGPPSDKQTPPVTANSGPIALTIKTDKATYAAADPITMTLT